MNNNESEKGFFGAILATDERDYTETLWTDKWLKENRVRKIYKYNQKEVWDNSCTSSAWVWCISDFLWIEFNLDFRKEARENQDTNWKWDYFWNWLRHAIKLYNSKVETDTSNKYIKDRNQELEYFRTVLTEENIKSIIDSGSSIVWWYRWSYYKDAQEDWDIDWESIKNGWWHCIRIVKYFYNDKWEFSIKYCDNYWDNWDNNQTHKYNIITVDNFLENNSFYDYWYYVKYKKS